ncbi:MAG TPA: hypothetical protein VFV01_24255 [Spirillospora sp.]|nr:hypothetical protein [Spirillospora sp.]
MPSDPARSPLGDQHVCSMPGCRRPSCFQVRLETGGPAPARGPRAAPRDTARDTASRTRDTSSRARDTSSHAGETAPRARDAASRAGDSCGTHLTDVVQALAHRCRGCSGETARIVVYATPEGRHAEENGPPGPFDRLTLGVIPI